MLGTFMEVLDTTVVNVSLPHIAGSLSATVDEATWCSLLPGRQRGHSAMTGWLANSSPQASVHGRRRRIHRGVFLLRAGA